MTNRCLAWAALISLSAPITVRAQNESTAALVHMANAYRLIPNITYRTVSNWEAKLDLYQPQGLTAPNPVLLYFHGGGWTMGSKESSGLAFLPYLHNGWTVVNVEYRLTSVALAPAAVEDARCALRWLYRSAKQYNFDTKRIVTSGQSAGGHLAMMAGMLPPSTPFDNTCPGGRSGGASSDAPPNTEEMRVAAIVDWFGISDVRDLVSGTNAKPYAVAWLGALPNREQLATELSPETYVKAGMPPIISIHGDADPTVPYSQKQRLHRALESASVAHELVTIPGGKHGAFTDAETMIAFERINSFLKRENLSPVYEPARTPAR